MKTPLLILSVIVLCASKGLNEDFSWARISYQWPIYHRSARSAQKSYSKNKDAIIFENEPEASKVVQIEAPPPEIDYNFETNIPMGINVWRNKLFITVPRRRLGVPSTLNYVWLNSTKRQNVPLIPYPNWQQNSFQQYQNNQNRFVSVYRTAVDPCNRLWFVDTGVIEIPGNITRIKPTTLIIMDLATDEIIQTHQFPSEHLRPTSNLASVTVDTTENTCNEAYAYIPDLGGYGLIVYDYKQNHSWRVTHNYFYLEPLGGEFHISGHYFQWNDGIFSVALTSILENGYRDLYFHSMAGTHLYKISTQVLRNETLATRSYHGSDFVNVGNRGELSQTSSSDLHKNKGVLFLGLVNQNAVGCWKIGSNPRSVSVIHKDDRKMIYPSDVKISGNSVLVLSNTMPEFLYGHLDYSQVNFRVWSNNVFKAIKGTQCE